MAGQRKILIVRLGAIGDVVRTLPSLHLLRKRFPEAFIAWAVEEKSAEILLGHPGLDEIILVERKFLSRLLKNPLTWPKAFSEIAGFFAKIREKSFDMVIDFHGSLKSGIISLATGAPERIGYTAGYSREGNFLFNNVRLPLRQKRISRMERNFTLLRHFGIELYGRKEAETDEIKAEITISEDDRACIEDYLKREELADKKRIILYPGASKRQAYKKWGADNYAALAEMLVKDADLSLILAWGPGEREECGKIVEKANAALWHAPSLSKRIHLAPATSLKQLAELIKRCSLFIGGDTGAMHISCAVGTPCAVLYGPTDPVVNTPWGKHFRVIHDEVDCSPCRKRRCKKGRCFEKLTPDVVYKEIEGFLKEILADWFDSRFDERG